MIDTYDTTKAPAKQDSKSVGVVLGPRLMDRLDRHSHKTGIPKSQLCRTFIERGLTASEQELREFEEFRRMRAASLS